MSSSNCQWPNFECRFIHSTFVLTRHFIVSNIATSNNSQLLTLSLFPVDLKNRFCHSICDYTVWPFTHPYILCNRTVQGRHCKEERTRYFYKLNTSDMGITLRHMREMFCVTNPIGTYPASVLGKVVLSLPPLRCFPYPGVRFHFASSARPGSSRTFSTSLGGTLLTWPWFLLRVWDTSWKLPIFGRSQCGGMF